MNRYRCLCGWCDGLEDLDASVANHRTYQETTRNALTQVLPDDCIAKVLNAFWLDQFLS